MRKKEQREENGQLGLEGRKLELTDFFETDLRVQQHLPVTTQEVEKQYSSESDDGPREGDEHHGLMSGGKGRGEGEGGKQGRLSSDGEREEVTRSIGGMSFVGQRRV